MNRRSLDELDPSSPLSPKYVTASVSRVEWKFSFAQTYSITWTEIYNKMVYTFSPLIYFITAITFWSNYVAAQIFDLYGGYGSGMFGGKT